MVTSSKDHAQMGGSRCPRCTSTNIRGREFTADGKAGYQHVVCEECGAEWSDTYRLTGYSDLDESNCSQPTEE